VRGTLRPGADTVARRRCRRMARRRRSTKTVRARCRRMMRRRAPTLPKELFGGVRARRSMTLLLLEGCRRRSDPRGVGGV